jgi:hypothetical protein
VLLPAWFVPGIAGYVIHRRTRIERAERAGDSCADLRAERAQLVRHGIAGEPAVAVERPLRLRHRLHEGNAPAPQRPDDELHRVDRLQALDAARGGHQAYRFVRQVSRIAFG